MSRTEGLRVVDGMVFGLLDYYTFLNFKLVSMFLLKLMPPSPTSSLKTQTPDLFISRQRSFPIILLQTSQLVVTYSNKYFTS